MRIAIFTDNFYPEISGISDSIIITAKELAKRGHKIQIYCPKYSKRDYSFVGLAEKEIKIHKNISVIRFPSLSFKSTGQGRFVIPFGRVFYKIKKFKPAVIHANLPFGVGVEGLIAAKINKIPLIGTNHTPSEEYIKNSQSKFIGNLIAKYSSWFYNQCLFVSTPSKATYEDMIKLGFKAEHKIISNPVSIPLIKNSEKSRKVIRDKYDLNGFVIVYAGRLSAPKRIDTIIKA